MKVSIYEVKENNVVVEHLVSPVDHPLSYLYCGTEKECEEFIKMNGYEEV